MSSADSYMVYTEFQIPKVILTSSGTGSGITGSTQLSGAKVVLHRMLRLSEAQLSN